MQQERVIFGKVNEKILRKPSVEEGLVRKSVLRRFALEAIDTLGVGEVSQLRGKIDELHPLARKHWWDSKTQATPREVWQTLLVLQFDGFVTCKTVTRVSPRSGKQTATFLWSRMPES